MIIFASFHALGIPVLMALFARQYKNLRVYSIGNFFSNRLWTWSAPGEELTFSFSNAAWMASDEK
jgi:hypothetical protein